NYNHWAGQSEKFSPASKPSCIAVPIHWAERPLGVLYLADELPRLFSSEDVTLLEQLAPLAGATLEQRRLLQQTRARWQEAETLRQAGAAVTEILSMDERLERILEQLGYVVPYDSASVQLMREDKLEIVGGRGFPEPQKIIGWQFPVPGDNPNTIVVQERRPVILRDARTAHTPFRESPHAHIRSWLGVPLIVHDRVIGLLSIDSVELNHFNQKHVRLVTPLADQIAVALENARLYDDLQQQMDELKRTQAQLVQSAKLAAVGELAAGVAHELNNPLTGVLGYAEIAMIELEPEHPSYKDLQGIRAEALRASRIVRHLLQFSRQSEPKRTPADINQVTRQTLDVIRYHLQTSNVQVEESYEADLPPLSLDEGQIRQVLLNLITNAFQAMPQGGQLRICSERRGDQIGISISDTGEGIAKDNLERIFDPFYSTKPSGTGLGLSVSLGIVQEHGGRITVESQPGQGSTFTVWLPIE
ncbi:MAG: GAF domain-containing protein, partial [Chloroflexia bacterium]|nr:GAF domain-containing protein [Chloroflexia bacterium]